MIEQSGLSQREIAVRLGVDSRTVRKWLAGDREMPYSAFYCLHVISNLAGLGPAERAVRIINPDRMAKPAGHGRASSAEPAG